MGRILNPAPAPHEGGHDVHRPTRGAARRTVLPAVLSASLLLAACSFTGQTFNTGGLDQIVIGRTTLAEATEALGAMPDQTWQQGDTLLARWGYKGTVATDAVYFRQEVWLRFGPDGTFQRLENTINVPENFRPRTQAQADHAAAQAAARTGARASSAAGTGIGGNGSGSDGGVAVPPRTSADSMRSDALSPGDAAVPLPVSSPQPLLPPGTTYTPGVSYPIGRAGS